MDLVFPEIKNDVTKCPTTHENEGANGFIPTETKPYSEWEFDAATAVLEKTNKRKKKGKPKKPKRIRHTKPNRKGNGRKDISCLKAARDGRPPEEIALAAVKGLSLLVIE